MTRVTQLIHDAGKYLLISVYPLPTHPTHNFTHNNGGNLETLPGWPKKLQNNRPARSAGQWDGHWDIETPRYIGSFHEMCSDPNFNFWTSQILWTEYELITCILDEMRHYCICCCINPTFIKWCKRYFLRDHFPPRIIKDRHTEWNDPLSLCLENVKCWYSLNIIWN